jgi:hypothetical protein
MKILRRFWVAPIAEKMMENMRLRWFGHVERRLVDYIVKRVDQMEDDQITTDRGIPRKNYN